MAESFTHEIMKWLRPKDLIALFVIAGWIYLKVHGINGELDPAIFLILGYYFVKRENGQDNGV